MGPSAFRAAGLAAALKTSAIASSIAAIWHPRRRALATQPGDQGAAEIVAWTEALAEAAYREECRRHADRAGRRP
jgi:hypothetical protein